MFKLLVITMLLSAFFMNGCNKTAENSTGEAKKPAILLDVRSADEFAEDHIPGAINIPHTEIAEKISAVAPDKSCELDLYCRSGRRVGIAIEALEKLGYKNTHNLGGLEDARKKISQ